MIIEGMDFSVRIYNCLKRAGINTKEELENKDLDFLKSVRNLSDRNIKELLDRKDINFKNIK